MPLKLQDFVVRVIFRRERIRELMNLLLFTFFPLLSKIYVFSHINRLWIMYVTISVYVLTRGGAIKFMGTKRHHDKWLKLTETYGVKGCFAMTELGHGSNVCQSNQVYST